MNCKLKPLVIFLSITLILSMSGCTDNGNIERSDITVAWEKTDDKPLTTTSPTPSLTATPTEKPAILKDDSGYIYAYKNDNFIIEYEGIIIKMYYKLIEHTFKGIVENTNRKTISNPSFSIILDTGREIPISFDEDLEYDEVSEIASKYVSSSFTGWRVSLNDNPPELDSSASGKLVTTIELRTKADSFYIDVPNYPVVKDFGIEVNGKRYAGVNQTFMFRLQGLEFTANYYWGAFSDLGKKTRFLNIKIVNNSDRSINGLQLYGGIDMLARYPYAKEPINEKFFGDLLDLGAGEIYSKTYASGSNTDFEIYRFDVHVYFGGPFTYEDKENMIITVIGDP